MQLYSLAQKYNLDKNLLKKKLCFSLRTDKIQNKLLVMLFNLRVWGHL